jgi:hypothetical protein
MFFTLIFMLQKYMKCASFQRAIAENKNHGGLKALPHVALAGTSGRAARGGTNNDGLPCVHGSPYINLISIMFKTSLLPFFI